MGLGPGLGLGLAQVLSGAEIGEESKSGHETMSTSASGNGLGMKVGIWTGLGPGATDESREGYGYKRDCLGACTFFWHREEISAVVTP